MGLGSVGNGNCERAAIEKMSCGDIWCGRDASGTVGVAWGAIVYALSNHLEKCVTTACDGEARRWCMGMHITLTALALRGSEHNDGHSPPAPCPDTRPHIWWEGRRIG